MSQVKVPNELLVMIIGDLSPESLLSFMLSCKQFHIVGAPIFNSRAVANPYYKAAAVYWTTLTGNRTFLKTLLEKGTPIEIVESVTAGTATFLHHAPSPCTAGVIESAIMRDSNLLACTYGTPLPALFWAVKNDHSALFKLVLRSNPDMEWRNPSGETALHAALCLRNEIMAFELLDHGADFMAEDLEGTCPLELAVQSCQALVEEILRLGADPDRVDNRHATALHHATMMGHEELIRLLLHYHANPNIADVALSTPLHLAAGERGMGHIVEALLENGADVTMVDGSGRGVLQIAEESGNPATVVILEKLYAARPGLRRLDGTTYLHLAAYYSSTSLTARLLKSKVSPNVRDVRGQTPLHIAAGRVDGGVVALLVDAGADPGARDSLGRTPLHVAAGMKGLELFWELVLLGGQTCYSERDAKGCTPLHMAARTVADPERIHEKGDGAERGELWMAICEVERELFDRALESRKAMGFY